MLNKEALNLEGVVVVTQVSNKEVASLESAVMVKIHGRVLLN